MTDATFEQAKHLLTLVSQKGTPREQLQKLNTSGLLADLLDANIDEVDRDDFRELLGLTPLELRITVDYGMTLEQMVEVGHYDWANPEIDWANPDITASCFPITGEGKKELVAEVIHFNRDISSEDAVTELGGMALRPGTIEELLAFGAAFPEMQRKFPIVELGSSCEIGGKRSVAYLDRYDSERSLSLDWWDDGWDRDYRFLAFRK